MIEPNPYPPEELIRHPKYFDAREVGFEKAAKKIKELMNNNTTNGKVEPVTYKGNKAETKEKLPTTDPKPALLTSLKEKIKSQTHNYLSITTENQVKDKFKGLDLEDSEKELTFMEVALKAVRDFTNHHPTRTRLLNPLMTSGNVCFGQGLLETVGFDGPQRFSVGFAVRNTVIAHSMPGDNYKTELSQFAARFKHIPEMFKKLSMTMNFTHDLVAIQEKFTEAWLMMVLEGMASFTNGDDGWNSIAAKSNKRMGVEQELFDSLKKKGTMNEDYYAIVNSDAARDLSNQRWDITPYLFPIPSFQLHNEVNRRWNFNIPHNNGPLNEDYEDRTETVSMICLEHTVGSRRRLNKEAAAPSQASYWALENNIPCNFTPLLHCIR